jgi:hypothetical protein
LAVSLHEELKNTMEVFQKQKTNKKPGDLKQISKKVDR